MTQLEDDNPNLEEIASEDFEEALEQQVETSRSKYNLAVRKYNTYLRDKLRYNIKYYREDGVLFYKKFKKNKIGYRR